MFTKVKTHLYIIAVLLVVVAITATNTFAEMGSVDLRSKLVESGMISHANATPATIAVAVK